jgi:hypothetical protein
MALLFCDGFDHYSTYTDKGWVGGGNYAPSISGNGRFGTSSLRMGDARASASIFVGNHTQGVVGFAIKGTFTDSQWIARVIEGSTVHLYLSTDSIGRLYVMNGSGSVVATGSTPALGPPFNVWKYIEMAYVIHDTTGSVTVYVNGQSYLTASSADTRYDATGTPNVIGVGWYDAGQIHGPIDYDDFYVVGGSTTPLGDVRVQSILPSGAGNTTQMTPSTGSNYACVDDAAPNADTDYVSETTAGEKDTYAFGNVTPTSGTIKGVQVMINARKDDAGSRSIAPVYRPASTDYDGATVSVGDSYAYYREITEVSPETSAAWTIAEVNGAEFGVKLIG